MQFGTTSNFLSYEQQKYKNTHRTKTCFGKGVYHKKQKKCKFPGDFSDEGKVKIF